MKRAVAILAFLLYLSCFNSASASISINELMYDLDGSDTGREWIEVKNDGADAVDFSLYKLFEANTNHSLTILEGDKSIASGGYAVIVTDLAKFKTDYPNFSGSIFDSSFSLSNDGETLAIKDADLNQVNEFIYTSSLGANGDGKSLQKVASGWVASVPTPGVSNTTSGSSDQTNSNTNTSTETDTKKETSSTADSSSSSSGGTLVKKQNKISVDISAPAFVFTGIPFEVTFKVIGLYGEDLTRGKLYWNFGNGFSKEFRLPGEQKFFHTYKYKGEYIVRLEYYANEYSSIPDAKDELKINVMPATVVISSVGNSADFFIELKNTADYDIDISSWHLVAGAKSFTFPKNTFLISEKSIFFSPDITGLSYGDISSLKLLSSSGSVVFDYGGVFSKPVPTTTEIKNLAVKNSYSSKAVVNARPEVSQLASLNPLVDLPTVLPSEKIGVENLGASAIDSSGYNSNLYLWLLGLVLIVGLGAGTVLFIRKSQRRVVESGTDFEILEE